MSATAMRDAQDIAAPETAAGKDEAAVKVQAAVNGEDVVNADAPTVEEGAAVPETEAAGETEARPAWITDLIAPFGDGDQREDPRYGDNFVLIKQEIDKLSGNDYDRIAQLAREVLAEEGKDLRVAGYLLLALSYISGPQGLRDGLWIYAGLLEQCADELFPRKPGARAAALRWLNNPKLQAYVSEQGEAADHETLQQIAGAIETINGAVTNLLGESEEDPPRFTLLDDWLKERLERTAPRPESKPEPEPKATEKTGKTEAASRPATAMPALPADGSELTESERLRHGQNLCRIFLEAGDTIRAVGMARALRWSNLRLPPAENGRTRLPAPRTAGLTAIRNALAEGDGRTALRLSEAMLFEPSGQFLLDLAWFSHEAAVVLDDEALADYLTGQTGLLLARLDGVLDLQFEDGTPFASAEARNWLEQCIPGESGGGAGLQARLDEELNALIDRARETARKQGLPEALNLFAGYGAYTERQRFLMRMAMAGLCLEHGRVEIAWPVIEELWQLAEERHLAWWDTDLVITLARYARTALRALQGQADEARRAEYERRLEAIHRTICRIDMQQALGMN